MARKHFHYLVVGVRFDKPCTAAEARYKFADNVHGTFYPTAYHDHDPEEFRVKSVSTSVRKPRRKP
jgi:hypothetical protein